MREQIKPDFVDHNAIFTVYDGIKVRLSTEDWRFLCEKRWFSYEPYRDEVEAEFGLYGAREKHTPKEVSDCIRACIEDLKNVMDSEIMDSDCSTLLTLSEDGSLIIER